MNNSSSWIKFFIAAGIPSGIAASYASIFTDNRIQENMLLDLNKEYLKDMGIACMGDIIAILRQAKIAHEETVRDRVLENANAKVPAAVAYRLNKPQLQVNANKIYEKILTKEEVVLPTKSILKRNIPIESQPQEIKKRKITLNPTNNSVQDEVNNLPSRSTTIFDRLGHAEKKVLLKPPPLIKPPPLKTFVVTNDKIKDSAQNTVFSRLGMKSINTINSTVTSVTSTSLKSNAPLEYQGVLKSPTLMRKITFSSEDKVQPLSHLPTMRADETPVSVKNKLRLTVSEPKKSVKFSDSVQYKEIELEPDVPTPKVMIRTYKSTNSDLLPSNKRIVSSYESQYNVKTLGMKKLDENKTTVFSRLGI